MAQDNKKVATLALVIFLGIFLQVLFTFGDMRLTPDKTVIAYTEAFLQMDPSMGDYLCADLKTDEETDHVGEYLYQRTKDAAERGLELKYLKSNLYKVETRTVDRKGDKMSIRITGEKRTAMNPLYAIVAKVFFLTDSHDFDAVVEVVKEGREWKVCGGLLPLAS